MPDPKTRAAQRLAALFQQLAEERGFRYGWQSELARELGISQNYVSKLHRGDRARVGLEVVEKVSQALGIERGFFLDPVANEPPDYHDYLRGRDERWRDVVESVLRDEYATEEEAEMLRSLQNVGNIPPDADVARALLGQVRMILRRRQRHDG